MKELLVDKWIDIQGYQGKYQVGYMGQIRRTYKNGKTRILNPYKKSGVGKKVYRDRLLIKLTNDKGVTKETMVHQIVALHFLGRAKQGHVVYHVNGMVTDNWASNLNYIDKKALGKLTGASSRRQPVVKINKEGEIIECYSSARECAKANYMSYQTIMDKCNLVSIKRSIFAPDGFAYAWEEDERKLNKIIRLIELETKGENSALLSNLNAVKQKYCYDF